MGPGELQKVRQAMRELGEASPQDLSAHLERRHGLRIDARFIPVVRASVLELEMLERARQAARAAAATAEGPISGPAAATGTRPQDAGAVTTAAA